MRLHWLFVICVVLSSIALTAAGEVGGGVTLTVEVNNVESARGKIRIGLYHKAKASNFPDTKRASVNRIVDAQKGTVSCVFPGLAPGEYAVAVFHDQNSNGELDKNLMGAPTEGIGFSRDARARFRAPSYSSAAFNVRAEPVHVTLRMRY